MFELLKPNEKYIIGAYIKRGDNTVLDIAVEAVDTPESIRKAMNTIRRAMTNYAPNTTPIMVAADRAQNVHLSTQTTASSAEQAAAAEPATPPDPAASDQKPDYSQRQPQRRCLSRTDRLRAFVDCSICAARDAESRLPHF